MARELFIHAGAHRTGSSSFQLMLARNRAVLRAAGVLPLYPGRDGAPGGRLRLRLPGPTLGPGGRTKLAAHLSGELERHLGGTGSDGPPRIVLSEENLPGRMLHFYAGQFYPAARDRLEFFAAALRAQGIGPPRRVVFVLRPYAELFASAYRRRAEDRPVPPFAEIAPAMAAMQAGWPDTVAALRDALRPDELVVVSHARRGRSVELLSLLLGAAADGLERRLEEPGERVNRSVSEADLFARQRGLRASSGAGQARDAGTGASVDGAARFAPRFTPDQQAALADRDAAHRAELAAMPGVTFLG